MGDVTRILADIEQGDPRAAEQLLPLVYDELRKLAAVKMAQEKPGQTLQATALVHEAWLRLAGSKQPQSWNSRGHFFAAATEAMRRILVDRARQRERIRHGGELERVDFGHANPPCLSLRPRPSAFPAGLFRWSGRWSWWSPPARSAPGWIWSCPLRVRH